MMAIRGFKISDLTGDILFGQTVYGSEATAQEIATRLRFFRGECFADLREGTPYFQEILIKGVDLARVRAIVRQVIQSVPSVLDVPRVEVSLDRATRAATITGTARDKQGAVIRSEDFPPLVIG